MKEIKPLTGLRFLAALWVAIFHIDIRLPMSYLPERAQAIIRDGSLGVTLFFVLSGFVLTYSHLKDFEQPYLKGIAYYRAFLFKRLARIYPAYIVGLLACILLSLRFGNLSWMQVALNATFIQPWVPSALFKWYGSGSWSVSAEIFFYLLFPIALPLLLRLPKLALWMVLVFSVATGTALGVAGTHHELRTAIFYNSPFCRFPEFLAGIVVGILILRHQSRVPTWLPLLLILTTAVYLSYTPLYYTSTRVLIHFWLIIPTIAAVIAGMNQDMEVFRWLGRRPFHYLGQISYCFYIVGILLVLILEELQTAGRITHVGATIAIFLIVDLFGAVFLHELVEKPSHRWLMQWHRKKQNKALGAITVKVNQTS